jgi:hypothetical protein
MLSRLWRLVRGSIGSASEGLFWGLKPVLLVGFDVRAEARTYLRSKSGYVWRPRKVVVGEHSLGG